MVQKLVTQKQKLHLARQMLESISEVANTSYYVFLGNHVPRESSDIPDITRDANTVHYDPYRNMQVGKRVSANDASLVIRNIPYEANTVYTMYDDTDEDMEDSDYYTIVNAGSYYHVFKCLDNNMGNVSTVEPNFTHIQGANTSVYQTSDGYRWKYMYSVTNTVKDKFASTDWFPFQANTTVQNAAVSGSIDIIKVDGTGAGYHNYVSGTFQGTHIRVGGNPKIYQLANTTIKQTNGYYTGCILYITTGDGAGEYSVISNSYSNTSGSYIFLEDELTDVPTNGSTWEVNPHVMISGYGLHMVNAVARALVNSSASNSIYRVEMLNIGSGYQYATAQVVANSVVGVSVPAEVRPIRVPYGGHGKDAATELGCTGMKFSVRFQNTESNTITSTNFFQQVGIIKDPIFANATFEISSSNGAFIANETIHKINPILCTLNATINTTSATLSANTGDFEYQFADGDYIYMKESNGTSHMLTTIQEVVNSSTITLATNGYFACTETMVYHANVTSNAVFTTQANSSIIRVANIQGVFQTDDIFVGVSSGGKAVINSVSRSDVTKGFNTFVQMPKLIGTLSSGSFLMNEPVFQGASYESANATAIVHSSNVTGGSLTLYITNQTGDFEVGSLIGASSLALASITTIHKSEIVEGSGEIVYIENISPVTRQNNQTETIRVNFTF